MRGALAACLILALGSIQPIDTSFPALPEDLEASGYELDSSGSGSGDWSEQGEIKNTKDHTNSKDQVRIFAPNAETNMFHDSSVLNFDGTQDSGSGFVLVANSRTFLENKDIFAAVIAGGAVGVVLAAALAALLIYAWQKKDNGGYILGQQSASGEDYLRPNRREVV